MRRVCKVCAAQSQPTGVCVFIFDTFLHLVWWRSSAFWHYLQKFSAVGKFDGIELIVMRVEDSDDDGRAVSDKTNFAKVNNRHAYFFVRYFLGDFQTSGFEPDSLRQIYVEGFPRVASRK